MLDTAISHRELLVALKRTLALQSHTKLPRAAVALSGGVDSLALYLLLREHYRRSGQGNDLAALTVNHALRPESGVEAKQLHARVRDARVHHEILSLPGFIFKRLARLGDHRKEHRGIEKLARQGRFEALTEACTRLNTRYLFLGHHADDQAETVLMRMLQGASWRGVAGIRPLAWNPASGCGIPGAEQIRVVRPLLSFPKSRLRATCEAWTESWFEDASNADASLTMRNAVRQFLGNTKDLPSSLQAASLSSLADHLQGCRHLLDEQISKALQACNIQLDEQIGQLSFEFEELKVLSNEGTLLALQGLSEAVTPSRATKNESMRGVLTMLQADHVEFAQTTAAGLVWRREGKTCHAWRQPWSASTMTPLSAQQVLWDGRFWVTVQTDQDVSVRCLTKGDMARLRQLAKHQGLQAQLQRVLERAIGAIRFTLPVLVNVKDEILALPSVNLSFAEVRYECRLAGSHKLGRLLRPGSFMNWH